MQKFTKNFLKAFSDYHSFVTAGNAGNAAYMLSNVLHVKLRGQQEVFSMMSTALCTTASVSLCCAVQLSFQCQLIVFLIKTMKQDPNKSKLSVWPFFCQQLIHAENCVFLSLSLNTKVIMVGHHFKYTFLFLYFKLFEIKQGHSPFSVCLFLTSSTSVAPSSLWKLRWTENSVSAYCPLWPLNQTCALSFI